MNEKTLSRLLRAAKGEEPPDKVIKNGRIVNVFTNSIDEDLAVSIKDGYITGISSENGLAVAEETEVIDAGGRYLCPGFIDSHTHLDAVLPFYELVPYALRGGTTTLISECSIVGNGCGMPGIQSFVDSTKGYPVRCYFLAPPLTPPFPEMERSKGITFAQFEKLLRREDFLGIGEGYWTRVVDGDDRVLQQASLALSLRKTLEGHSAGARGSKLVQYAVTGITSCHEATTMEEALEKLRLGVYVMIREGWVRSELGELSRLKDSGVDERRLILVSDVFDPIMLYNEGYMDVVVRKAVKLGFTPMQAIKMATINAADYYGLRYLGAVAPLRHADILFLSDLSNLSIEQVMANGEFVWENGASTRPIVPFTYPPAMMQTIKTHRVDEDDFRIKARPAKNQVRVIVAANETITREKTMHLPVRDGYVQEDLTNDVVHVAVINRKSGKTMGKGFIQGTGIREGAVTTTVVWDTCNILVIGSTERDMALAVNHLIDIQGGYAVVKEGKVIYDFPMPAYGLIAPYGMEEIEKRTRTLETAMAAIGSTLAKPFLTLQTIPFTGLPFLRITDKGLMDVKNRKLVSLFV
jgi:adenine deaminase